MNRLRQTIGAKVKVSGVGLHSGQDVSVTLSPAAAGTGCRFVRTDCEESVIVATIGAVRSTIRNTTIGPPSGNGSIQTVEHLLSALHALGIDDCHIEVDGPEVPLLDGTALPFVAMIREAGVQTLPGERIEPLVVSVEGTFEDPDTGARYHYRPSPSFSLAIELSFPSFVGVDDLSCEFEDIYGEFVAKIAPSRTFCFSSEIPALQRSGLIRGGSLASALVIFDGKSDRATTADLLEYPVDAELPVGGQINPFDPEIPDEPARHKGLDLVGDLALLGRPIAGSIRASRPGHRSNALFARHLHEQFGTPSHPVSHEEPRRVDSMTINEIKAVLPHRYPFLLVDRVEEIDRDAGRVVGIKNVTVNEPFFQGHFPEEPIMPGVLIVEAMAQVGGLLLQDELGTDGNRLALFMGIREAKFRKPVVPGDVLRLELVLTGKKFNTYVLDGKATVDGKPVAQATITVAITERKG